MSTPTQNQKPSLVRFPIRVLFVSIGLLLLLTGATLIILNALSVMSLPSAWSSALGVTFTTLGVIISFGQWLLPFSPRATNGMSGARFQISKHISESENLHESFRQQKEHIIDKTLKKGVIIVYMTDREVAHEINLVPHVSWLSSLRMKSQLSKTRTELVKRHKVNTGYVCAAVFDNLEPDDYIVWIDPSYPTSVSVFSNEVTTINWQ